MSHETSVRLAQTAVRSPDDVGMVRRQTKSLALLLGLTPVDQVRLGAMVAATAFRALRLAGECRVDFAVEPGARRHLIITISGCADLPPDIFIDLPGITGLIDELRTARSDEGAASLVLAKPLPDQDIDAEAAAACLKGVATPGSGTAPPELDVELLSLAQLLEDCEEERTGVARELMDTNRGVVALHGQMEEQARMLRDVNAVKDRFVAFASHEFRTPLNSIAALGGILLDRVDGDLNSEQEKQVRLMVRAANDLTVIVNDLLDLAKVQSGTLEVECRRFQIDSLFAALRGMFRPLALNPRVDLLFDEPEAGLSIYSDEPKVSQILRNFISNALKFTDSGSITVIVEPTVDREELIFRVTDTGIGIADEDQDKIFDEYRQVTGAGRGVHRGTGLGLPLARAYAEKLGGSVGVQSRLGEGSTFWLALPWEEESTVLKDE